MMRVYGYVTMSIAMNVIGLETDAVYVDEYGDVRINNPDQFFDDWVMGWIEGQGELLGADDEKAELVGEDADEDDC